MYKLSLIICLLFVLPCAINAQPKPVQQLDGEWAVMYAWTDHVLIFKNKRAKDFKQESFPSYNTIIFNPASHLVDVQTYGTPGCGTAAVENLEMQVHWAIEGSRLHMKGDYSNYSGRRKLDAVYTIERKGNQLILRR